MGTVAYNTKISKRANDSIRRRQATLRKEKRIITFSIILIISIIAILCSSIKAMASSNDNERHYEKMYKSIVVESGDTLWDLADEYNICSDLSKEDYIKEVKKLNNLNEGQIKAGQSIIVAYFEIEK